jgi:hypothetical protein
MAGSHFSAIVVKLILAGEASREVDREFECMTPDERPPRPPRVAQHTGGKVAEIVRRARCPHVVEATELEQFAASVLARPSDDETEERDLPCPNGFGS